MTYRRRTIRREFTLDGLGLHSGVPVTVRFRPSSEGIRFFLGAQSWTAIPENVTDTTRCTKLGEISTVEHAMSALAGADVTDVDVLLSAPELPALDGSSKEYYEPLIESGSEELGEVEAPGLFSRVFLQEGDVKIAISSGDGRWRFLFDPGARWPGAQEFEAHLPDDYAKEVGPARTFGFESELPMIRAAGLAKGLNEQSALVLGADGYLNPPARFEKEPARHKLLDAVGDLYLAGVPIRFLNVVCERSGHASHVRAARLIQESLQQPQTHGTFPI